MGLSFTSNSTARFASVVSVDWDNVTNQPASALSRVNDTNVTLTLSGDPNNCLISPTTITAGWTGTLSPARGGTGVANNSASTVTISGNFATTWTVTGTTTLTLPTTGTLATLAGAEAFTNKTSYNKVTITSPATSATLTLIDGTTVTGPASTGTIMTLGNTETVTGVKTFGSAGAVGRFKLAGTTSGTTTVDATAVASGTLTLPAATDTLVGKATTDVFTNKTFNSTATGNVLQVSGVTVSAGQYPGETSTGNATAGNVGEYSESIVTSGSAVALTTATAKNVTTLTLGAGDWDISGVVMYITAGTTSVTEVFASLNPSADNTLDTTVGRVSGNFFAAVVPGSNNTAFNVPIGPYRQSLSGSTTIRLIAHATFTVAALTAYGYIRARRVR